MRVVKKTQDSSADFSANYTGGVIYAGRMGFGSVQVEWDTNPQGTLTISGRNDRSLSFVPLDTFTLTGSPGSHLFNLEFLSNLEYQISFTHTGGAGTATIISLLKATDV